jgi:hypothetical protein
MVWLTEVGVASRTTNLVIITGYYWLIASMEANKKVSIWRR